MTNVSIKTDADFIDCTDAKFLNDYTDKFLAALKNIENRKVEYIIQEIDTSNLNDLTSEYGDKELYALTYLIIGAAMEVHTALGKGFSEKVYQDCLCIEFEKKKISYLKEKKFEIVYKGVKIPHHYFADFIIEDQVVLEIKANSQLIDEHTKQILNYLAVSKCRVGLVVNFGESSLKFKRVILTK